MSPYKIAVGSSGGGEGSGRGEPDGVRARRRRSCVCIVGDVTDSCNGVVMYLRAPAGASRRPRAGDVFVLRCMCSRVIVGQSVTL